MRTPSLFLLCFLAASPSFAQNPDGASIKVHEGVELHDKGDYKKAIKKYDEALKLDKDNLTAMAEKAMTLNALGELEESAALCQEIIEKHDGAKEAPMVYVTYGNCMDQLKRPEASLRVYDKGISVLPEMYMLHFNKGITLMGMDSSAAALKCFERSARLNPFHPGTQNAMARILYMQKRSIPATLAFCRFFALEQESERAKQNLGFLMHDMQSGGAKTDAGGTTIEVDASMVRDSTDTVHVENDFRDEEVAWNVSKGVDLVSVLMQAMQSIEKSKETGESVAITGPETPNGLSMRLEQLAAMLKNGRAKNHGFQWEYHAAWLIALNNAGHCETLAHLALLNSDEKDIRKWLEANGPKVNAYFGWEKDYTAQYLKEKSGE